MCKKDTSKGAKSTILLTLRTNPPRAFTILAGGPYRRYHASLLPSQRPDPLSWDRAAEPPPTMLAQTAGFLLGNAHRCGVQNARRARRKVIHDMIVAAATTE